MEKLKLEKFGRVSLDPRRMSAALKERREAMGLTLREVAEQADVGTTTVHSLEQGKIKIQLDTFLKVLAVLDILPEHILQVDGAETTLPPTLLEREVLDLIRSGNMPKLLAKLAEILDNR